jgi:hypothetical protein
MPRTRYNSKYLRRRVNEVEDLRNEEQPKSFAEMSQDAIYRKNHSGEVAVCVTNKDLCREPIVNK